MHRLRTHAGGSGGFLMVETVVAIIIFALVATAMLAGVSTAKLSGSKTEGHSTAENLVRNQIEEIFSQPYLAPPVTFTPIAAPTGYTVTATAVEYVSGDPNMERIEVTITRSGEVILVIETLRTKG